MLHLGVREVQTPHWETAKAPSVWERGGVSSKEVLPCQVSYSIPRNPPLLSSYLASGATLSLTLRNWKHNKPTGKQMDPKHYETCNQNTRLTKVTKFHPFWSYTEPFSSKQFLFLIAALLGIVPCSKLCVYHLSLFSNRKGLLSTSIPFFKLWRKIPYSPF